MSDWLLKDYAVVMILPFVNKVFLSQVGEVFPPINYPPPSQEPSPQHTQTSSQAPV